MASLAKGNARRRRGKTAVKNQCDVISFGAAKLSDHGVEGAVRDAGDTTLRPFSVVIEGAEDFDILRPITIPTSRSTDAASMTGEVDKDGVSVLDGRVISEVTRKIVFDIVLRSLFAEKHADLVARNVEIVGQEVLDTVRIVDGSLEVPYVARLVFVDSNDESENA